MDYLTVKKLGSVTVVHLGSQYGSLNANTAEQAEASLLRLAAEIDPPHLLLDCRDTVYCGSLFIGALVRCYQRIQSRGGWFALCCLQPYWKEEVDAMNLGLLWPIYNSVEEAVTDFEATVSRHIPSQES